MYLYFDYDRTLKTAIPHGEIPRQGSDLTIKVCLPLDFWRKTGKTDEEYSKSISFEYAGGTHSPEFMLPTQGNEEQFNKLYATEDIFDFRDGDTYLTYKYKLVGDSDILKNSGQISGIIKFYKAGADAQVSYEETEDTKFQYGKEYYIKSTYASQDIYYLVNVEFGANIPSGETYYEKTVERGEIPDEILISGVANITLETTYGENERRINQDVSIKYANIINEIAKVSAAKEDRFRFSSMPNASNYKGKIVQFVGTTADGYTQGYFYKSVESGSSWTWQEIDVNRKEVFLSDKSSMTFDQVKNAVNEGKIVFLKTPTSIDGEWDFWEMTSIHTQGSNQYCTFFRMNSNDYEWYHLYPRSGDNRWVYGYSTLEIQSNKKDEISNSSTYYPSSKAVYDYAQPKTDSTLTTASKNIAGAINELNANKSSVSVSEEGDSQILVKYITVNGVERKLGGSEHLDTLVETKRSDDDFTYSGDTVTFHRSYKNLETGVTATKEEVLGLANDDTAGLMSPSDRAQIYANKSAIEGLQGVPFRLRYTEKDNPTATEINQFVIDSGYTPSSSISVLVAGTKHLWRYYGSGSSAQWVDDGVDTVTQFTNSNPGIIKGSESDGQVFAELDGTGSVYGWSDLKTSVTNIGTNKQDKTDNSLMTTSKNIVGAINELNTDKSSVSVSESGTSQTLAKYITVDGTQWKLGGSGGGEGPFAYGNTVYDDGRIIRYIPTFSVYKSGSAQPSVTKNVGYALRSGTIYYGTTTPQEDIETFEIDIEDEVYLRLSSDGNLVIESQLHGYITLISNNTWSYSVISLNNIQLQQGEDIQQVIADLKAIPLSGGQNYITVNLPNKEGRIAVESDIPTKTSDLTNDSNFITSSDIAGKENSSNKVALGSSNTTEQYPNAKSVWDVCENIRQVAEGKTATYIINSQSDITGTKGSDENYTNVTAITGVTLSNLKIGDTILVKQLDVPDYWVSQISPSVSLNKLESSKIDISTKVDKTTTVNGHALSSNVTVTKSDVGLGSVVNAGMDNTPTSGSNNYVKSSGVYTALQGKQNSLPTTTTAGQLLMSTATAGVLEFGTYTPAKTVIWEDE